MTDCAAPTLSRCYMDSCMVFAAGVSRAGYLEGPAPRGDGLAAVQVADGRDRAHRVEVDFLRGRTTGASVPVHPEPGSAPLLE